LRPHTLVAYLHERVAVILSVACYNVSSYYYLFVLILLYVCPHAIYMCLHTVIRVLILLYLHERVAVILLVVEPHDGADVLSPEHV